MKKAFIFAIAAIALIFTNSDSSEKKLFQNAAKQKLAETLSPLNNTVESETIKTAVLTTYVPTLFHFPGSESDNVFFFNYSAKKESPEGLRYIFNIREVNDNCSRLFSDICKAGDIKATCTEPNDGKINCTINKYPNS